MKGISTVFSHMSYIAIGIVALSLIVASVYMWGDKVEETFLQRQLKLVSSSVFDDIVELKMLSEDSNAVPKPGETKILSETGTEMPDKISNENYRVEFSSDRIIVSSTTSKGVVVERIVPVTFDIEDSSAISPFVIRLERDSGGDKIYLVD